MKNCMRCGGLLCFDAWLGALVCCACARPLYLPVMPLGPYLQDEYLAGYSHRKRVPKYVITEGCSENEDSDLIGEELW
jgi:hypothetical protein